MSASLLRLGGWRSVAALVVVAGVATGIGQTGVGHALLEKAGLIQRPAVYTALSFKAPDMPVEVRSAGKRAHYYSLTVKIQNADTTSRDYLLSLLLVQRPGHARLINTGAALVGPGKTAPITLTGKITCARVPVEFIVQLAGSRPREALHAWTTCRRTRN
jgi:hypothetical protein